MDIHDDARNGTLTETNLKQYCASSDIDELDPKRRMTPLAAAVWEGHVSVVKLLLKNKANVKRLSSHGRSALWFAASKTRKNRPEIVRLLLANDANVDATSADLDNYTPLMSAIVEFKDVNVISQLVDAGASVTAVNSNGETAQALAENTKDPAVIKALLPKSERNVGRIELINLIVSLVLFIVAWVNKTFVRGMVKNLFGMSGVSDPGISKDIPEPQTVDDFKKNINSYVADTGMDQFFAPNDDPFLQTLAEKAVELKFDPTTSLGSSQNIVDLTKLSLYQPVIYCDDSGSMKIDGRVVAQTELVNRIARITTRLVPDDEGVELCFINHESSYKLNAEKVKDIMSKIKPNGYTEIGTNLKKKILQPLVYDLLDRDERLKRPLLISVITDGCPGGKKGSEEKKESFGDAIAECVARLVEKGYKPESVKFQISQIGTDENSKEFLDGLRNDQKVRNVLYCTTDRLDSKYAELKKNERHLEEWLLKTLMGPIMHRSQE